MKPLSRNVRVVLMSTATVVAMVGLTYASVPLYRLFCQVTGFDGTVRRADTAPDTIGGCWRSLGAGSGQSHQLHVA